MAAKLFVVVRADLSLGQQAVQGMHALQEFNEHHPLATSRWYTSSNTLALLTVPDERALGVLLRKAIDRRIPVSAFREPDRGNEMTALVLGPEGRRLTQGLRLAYQHDSPPKRQPQDSRGRNGVSLETVTDAGVQPADDGLHLSRRHAPVRFDP